MRFISFFAGIGGFDLGFERAGMECVAQIEIDPFCQKVLAKHWPNVLRFGDIRNVGKHNLPEADVFIGGFPCQPHSTAGKRKGAKDDRNLWPEYFRVIDECRPAWVVGENVLGIRTTILDQVLSDMESLEYSTVTLDLPAAGFNAPHKRERIFIVAYSKSGAGRIPEQSREESLHASRVSEKGNVANAHSFRFVQSEIGKSHYNIYGINQAQKQERRSELYAPVSSGEAAANAAGEGLEGKAGAELQNKVISGIYSNAEGKRLQGEWTPGEQEPEAPGRSGLSFGSNGDGNFWQTEPGVCGVVDGVPDRVDRIRTLGNAVVPQVAEFIADAIIQTGAH